MDSYLANMKKWMFCSTQYKGIMMKTVSLFALSLVCFTLPGFAESDNYYPFVSNGYNYDSDSFGVTVRAGYNVGNYWMLMTKESSDYIPSFNQNKPFYRLGIRFNFFNFHADVGRFVLSEPYIEWDSCQISEKQAYYPITTFSWTPIQKRYFDFGLSLQTYNGIIGFIFSKSFERLSYSVCFEEHVMFILGAMIPNSRGISVAYRLQKNISIFEEFRHHTDAGWAKSGYMNTLGISVKYKRLSIAVFHNLIYDNENYLQSNCPVSIDRLDNRFGLEIKFGH